MSSAFRRALERADAAIFSRLGDVATVDGLPVQGMFEPEAERNQVGTLETELFEPRLVLRHADAAAAARGSRVVVDLPAPAGGEYDVLRIESLEDGLAALVLRPRE